MDKRFLSRLKTTALIISIIVNLCFTIFFLHDWPRIRLILWNIKRSSLYSPKEGHSQTLEDISAIVRSKALTKTKLIDQIRVFVYSNSIHLEDGNTYAFNTPYVLSRMLQTYKNNQNPPHLTCGPRAFAMKAILDYMGIESRKTNIYKADTQKIGGHTFLEVFNPDTKRWEVQDPHFNIYYINSKTRERLSLIQLILYDLKDVLAISTDNITGWDENKVKHLNEGFFGVAVYEYKAIGLKSIVVVNRERFDISHRYPKDNNRTFIEFAKYYFDNPVFLFY